MRLFSRRRRVTVRWNANPRPLYQRYWIARTLEEALEWRKIWKA